MKTIHCPRCSKQLSYAGQTEMKPGGVSFMADIYMCPKCGKMEFFAPVEEGIKVAKTTCAVCKTSYDIDFPRCPACGAANPVVRK